MDLSNSDAGVGVQLAGTRFTRSRRGNRKDPREGMLQEWEGSETKIERSEGHTE